MGSLVEFATAPNTKIATKTRKVFVNQCHFIMSAPSVEHLPKADRIEVCFIGRSNVGKSSIINALANCRKLARASNTPGRTREINIFALGNKHYLADLPGYGYAKMSKKTAVRAAALIESYITGRPSLRRVFILIDSRRGLMDSDETFMRRLDKTGVSYQIVLTKLDKLPPKKRAAATAPIQQLLPSHPALFPVAVATSTVKVEGIDALRCQILSIG